MLTLPKPLVFLVLDGFGYSSEQKQCHREGLCGLPGQVAEGFPMTLLNCFGKVLSLLGEQIGNSRVGLRYIGSSRYVPQAFSKVDVCSFFSNTMLYKIVDAVKEKFTVLHTPGLLSPGENIEQMADMETGQHRMAHGTNSVYPVYVCGNKPSAESGSLSNLAPTMLKILGIMQPIEITGRSLLESA